MYYYQVLFHPEILLHGSVGQRAGLLLNQLNQFHAGNSSLGPCLSTTPPTAHNTRVVSQGRLHTFISRNNFVNITKFNFTVQRTLKTFNQEA